VGCDLGQISWGILVLIKSIIWSRRTWVFSKFPLVLSFFLDFWNSRAFNLSGWIWLEQLSMSNFSTLGLDSHHFWWTFELFYYQVVHCVVSETTGFSNSKDKQNSFLFFLVNYLSDFCLILFGVLGVVRFAICYYSISISESTTALNFFSVSGSVQYCSLLLQPVRLTESFDSAPFFNDLSLVFLQQIVWLDCAFHCHMQ
jgi:hypothetical protein